MRESYLEVYEGGEGEITEKKSRFIATVKPVKEEAEAAAFIEEMRKKYWNATHNCTAFSIGIRNELTRCSDDGEPGGTAGRPMLDVLLGENIHDTAVVVTRYFGGILLGTGGLVRAYQGAAKEGLASSLIITRIQGVKLKITTDYTGLGKIQYILGERGIPVLDCSYTEKVELTALVPEALWPALEEELTDGTNGKAVLEEAGKCFYGDIDGKIQVLE